MRNASPLTFIGHGNAGSWQMRGRQIAAALGVPALDYRGGIADIRTRTAIMVKRVPGWVFAELKRRGTYVVWDPVDFWAQPDALVSTKQRREVMAHAIAERLPDEVIVANEVMRKDVLSVAPSIATTIIPHHADPRVRLWRGNAARKGACLIGYAGRFEYVQEWAPAILDYCKRRGHLFDFDPVIVPEADVLIGPRCGKWDTLTSRAWKSNVKQANALAQGVPFVSTPHASYEEHGLLLGATQIGDGLDQFLQALDVACDPAYRARVRERCAQEHARGFAFSLRSIANAYASLYKDDVRARH